jgi:hypothetical protein
LPLREEITQEFLLEGQVQGPAGRLFRRVQIQEGTA